MNYKYSGKSDIGLERKINQDCLGVASPSWGSIFIVSDGFGHEKGGVFASRAAVDIFISEFSKEEPKDIKKFAMSTFKNINKHIYYHKVSEFNKAMLGCTTVVIIIQGNIAHITHIGDSRAYLVREHNLEQLTKDHSYIQSLIDSGDVTLEKAQMHPKRHVLSKALGSHKNPIPSYNTIDVKTNDKFILCSDGVWGFISHDSLLDLIDNNDTDHAVKKVISHIKKTKGLDNITLQLIHFDK